MVNHVNHRRIEDTQEGERGADAPLGAKRPKKDTATRWGLDCETC